jgi:two-component system response regulator AtoC
MDQPEIERIGDDLYFVAASPLTRRLRSQAELLSQTDVPVLITGESGSGKATAAQLIHSLSLRSSFPFVTVDCGAVTPELLESELFGHEYRANGKPEIVPGKFERCARGTVLLRDFDAVPQRIQDRLLTLLLTREVVRCDGQNAIPVDVRVIASLEGDSDAMMEDIASPELYHRLNVFRLQVPPLRDRREEIPLLLGHFMNRLTRRYGVPAPHFTKALLDACQRHCWPGNLRELENFVKRFLAVGDEQAALEELQTRTAGQAGNSKSHSVGDRVDATPLGSGGASEKPSLKLLARNAKGAAERHAITQALKETHWNRKAAARLLNISYRGLLYKIDEYQLIP